MVKKAQPFIMVINLIATQDYVIVKDYQPAINLAPLELTTITGREYTRIAGELEEGFSPSVMLPQFYQMPVFLKYSQVVDCYTGQPWSCFG